MKISNPVPKRLISIMGRIVRIARKYPIIYIKNIPIPITSPITPKPTVGCTGKEIKKIGTQGIKEHEQNPENDSGLPGLEPTGEHFYLPPLRVLIIIIILIMDINDIKKIKNNK